MNYAEIYSLAEKLMRNTYISLKGTKIFDNDIKEQAKKLYKLSQEESYENKD